MRTGFTKPFLSALIGSALLLVTFILISNSQPRTTIVEAAPSIAVVAFQQPALAASTGTTLTLEVSDQVDICSHANITVSRTIANTGKMTVELNFGDNKTETIVAEDGKNSVQTTHKYAYPSLLLPGKSYYVTATIWLTKSVHAKNILPIKVNPCVELSTSASTFSLGKSVTITTKISPTAKFKNNEQLVYTFDDGSKAKTVSLNPTEVTTKDNQTVVAFPYTYKTAKKPGTSVFTINVTYSGGVYEVPSAKSSTQISVTTPASITIVSPSANTSVALKGPQTTPDGRNIIPTGSITVEAQLWADTAATQKWIPGDKAQNVSFATDYGTIGKLVAADSTGLARVKLETRTAGTAKAIKAEYGKDPYLIQNTSKAQASFTRTNDQGIYEIAFTPGMATKAVSLTTPSSLAAIDNQDKNIGSVEVSGNVYDTPVIMQFTALDRAALQQQLVKDGTFSTTTQLLHGYFLLQFYFADGDSTPLQDESNFSAPITLKYTAPSGKDPYTAFWNIDSDSFEKLANDEATNLNVTSKLKKLGEYAKFGVVGDTTPPPPPTCDDCKDVGPSQTTTATLKIGTLEIAIAPGTFSTDLKIRVQTKQASEVAAEVAKLTFAQGLYYYALECRETATNKVITCPKPLKDIVHKYTLASNLAATTAVSGTIIPATLNIAGYDGTVWSVLKQTSLSGSTVTAQSSIINPLFAAVGNSKIQLYLPIISRS